MKFSHFLILVSGPHQPRLEPVVNLFARAVACLKYLGVGKLSLGCSSGSVMSDGSGGYRDEIRGKAGIPVFMQDGRK